MFFFSHIYGRRVDINRKAKGSQVFQFGSPMAGYLGAHVRYDGSCWPSPSAATDPRSIQHPTTRTTTPNQFPGHAFAGAVAVEAD